MKPYFRCKLIHAIYIMFGKNAERPTIYLLKGISE